MSICFQQFTKIPVTKINNNLKSKKMMSNFNKTHLMIQRVLLHAAQKLSTSLNKRQISTELSVITIAGEQPMNGHQCDSITVHQNWSWKSETTVLKLMIMIGWNPTHQGWQWGYCHVMEIVFHITSTGTRKLQCNTVQSDTQYKKKFTLTNFYNHFL